MTRSRSLLLLTAATAAVPAIALSTGGAQAATKTVDAGVPSATKTVDAGIPRGSHRAFRRYGTDVNAFFPSSVTIHVGDRVAFKPSGFHTVHLLSRKGGRPIQPFVADVDRRARGFADATGAPFWFEGQPQWNTTPALRRSRFGKRFSFTGAKPLLSGLQGAGTGRPMTVTFKRPGTFKFVCDYHHGMKGTVRVLPRKRAVPSRARDRAAIASALDRRLRVARSLKDKPVPAGIVNVGVAAPGGLEFYDFSPKIAHVKVGGTLEFRMSPGSMETHAVAAGPGLPDTQPRSYLGTIARTFETVTPDARAVYPSEPAGATAAFTPFLHGNGFWSSGILDRRPATPFPASRRITFPVIGNYVFSCLIHKYMHTTVLVERN